MEELRLNKITLLTEGTMLAVVPATVYFLAYQYEVGYFSAFGAPEDLVSVDITSIITFGIAAFGIWAILYNILNSLWHTWLINITEMSWKQLLLEAVTLIFMLFLLFYLLYPFSWIRTVIYPALFVFLAILAIKWSTFPKWLTAFIFFMVLAISVSHGIGHFTAASRINFTIIRDKNIFVIRKLGDYLLCSTYDAKSKTFTKTFQIVPFKDDLNLEYRNIGPLRPQP